MKIFLTTSLILILGSIHPIHMLFPDHSEDMEGSGYGSGFGSGDGSEQVSPDQITKIMDRPNGKEQGFDSTRWPIQDSEYVVIGNSKSFMENKDIFAGVLAGGSVGVILAVCVASILIYKWHHKDNSGYILGQPSYTP